MNAARYQLSLVVDFGPMKAPIHNYYNFYFKVWTALIPC